MTERRQKKKKSTMREMAVGGGLMAIFLPVIIVAVVWAAIGVLIGAAYALSIIGDGVALWPLLVVYGGLLLAMLIFAYKFSARFALLTRRLIGLMRERRRIRTETRAAVTPQDSSRLAAQPQCEVDTAHASQRTTAQQ